MVSFLAVERWARTVTSPRSLLNFSSVMFSSVRFEADTSTSPIVFEPNPIAENSSEYVFPADNVSVKTPSTSVLTPPGAPRILTETPGIGSFFWLRTLPVILPVCAKAAKPSESKKHRIIIALFIMPQKYPGSVTWMLLVCYVIIMWR